MKLLLSFTLICIALSLTACGFEIVDTGYRGIETRYGKVVGEPLPEGLHFYNPVTSNIVEMSVRENNLKVVTEAFTRDNQKLDLDVELVWSVNPVSVGHVYTEVGDIHTVESTRVKNNFMGGLKDAIGKQETDKIVQNRDQTAQSALEEVRRKLDPMGVIVHSLNISDLKPHPEYQKAVEAKMEAKQRAEQAINDTVRIKEIAKQTVETATAEAEAMRIKSKALSENKGLTDYELALKWNGELPQYMFGNSVPMINLKNVGN